MRVRVRTRISGRGLDRLGGMVVWCGGGAHGERRAPTLVDAPGCLYIQDRAIKNVSVLSHCSSLDLFRRTTERAYCVVQKTLRRIGRLCLLLSFFVTCTFYLVPTETVISSHLGLLHDSRYVRIPSILIPHIPLQHISHLTSIFSTHYGARNNRRPTGDLCHRCWLWRQVPHEDCQERLHEIGSAADLRMASLHAGVLCMLRWHVVRYGYRYHWWCPRLAQVY
jgi:hypothetical protein